MEGATPYVLEDTRFGDVAITHAELFLWGMFVLFRLHPIDFMCECVTANIDILDRGFELREGRVMAVHMVGWERLRGTKQSPPAMRSAFLHSA